MRPLRSSVIALLLALLATGCGAPPSPTQRPPGSQPESTAPATTASAAPSAGAAADLARLLETLERTHPEPFHGVPREEFVRALDAYEASLPSLTPNEAMVELMRVVAMLSREGRDGHQFALPLEANDGPMLPLRIYEFAEGVFVTDALEPDADLVGARITAVAGTPIAEVLDLVEPLVPRDGPATVPAFRPILVLRTPVLEGLGIVESASEPVAISVETAEGDARTVDVSPITLAEHVEWSGPFGVFQLPIDPESPYLANPAPYAMDELDDGRTLYLRYRFVSPPAVSSARERLAAGGIERLVLDLRQNPGGNNTTYGPLLSLVREFAAANPGRLVVLIDRVTFSAAANLATEIEQSTDATFVGEPMGGGLNFWDDVRWVELAALPVPMQVGISTRYWQKSTPGDPRLTIDPDVPVPVTAADHFAHRDPALAAALRVGG